MYRCSQAVAIGAITPDSPGSIFLWEWKSALWLHLFCSSAFSRSQRRLCYLQIELETTSDIIELSFSDRIHHTEPSRFKRLLLHFIYATLRYESFTQINWYIYPNCIILIVYMPAASMKEVDFLRTSSPIHKSFICPVLAGQTMFETYKNNNNNKSCVLTFTTDFSCFSFEQKQKNPAKPLTFFRTPLSHWSYSTI